MAPERVPAEPLMSPPQAWGQRPTLFVYYRVHSQNLDHAVLVVQQQQQQLRGRNPGLQAVLMRRSDADPTQATLMEVYAVAGAGAYGLPAALAQEIEADMGQALQGLLLSARHTEAFTPCA